ncbi:uncharacterized protein LOC135697550 isoform X1 [Ochlerotatus camptorhynchus]|uniref:uncharacterized protein LOC135697550 isoform X1 n=1 Tax=Ochlerotatus camptorhynchus TaxID=644619 RepID=UPI0031DF8EF7
MKLVSPLRAAILALVMALAESAGEADYTLDDSFWNEESPVVYNHGWDAQTKKPLDGTPRLPGEVERLLKEHQQNQELVEKIGRNSYQIIYPVQLRHHEKMGISTREVGTKVRYRSRASSYSPSQSSSSSSMNSITTFHHHNYNYNKNVTRTRKSYYPDDATMSTDELARMVCAFDF